ncbi:transposase [Staphylococcus simulans]
MDYVLELKDIYIKVNTIRMLIKNNKSELLTKEIASILNEQNLDMGLRRVIKSFKTFLPEIQNTLKYPERSNGAIEAMNNNIKVLKRVAYGYRNFYNFRNRILVKHKLFAGSKSHYQISLDRAI